VVGWLAHCVRLMDAGVLATCVVPGQPDGRGFHAPGPIAGYRGRDRGQLRCRGCPGVAAVGGLREAKPGRLRWVARDRRPSRPPAGETPAGRAPVVGASSPDRWRCNQSPRSAAALARTSPAHPVSLAGATTSQPGPGPGPGPGPDSRTPAIRFPAIMLRAIEDEPAFSRQGRSGTLALRSSRGSSSPVRTAQMSR
jgi:hypothetical protein